MEGSKTANRQFVEFGKLICRIAAGETMSRETTCEAYRQIILSEQPELQQGAFMMAHITRNPTTEELAGAWDAIDRYDTIKIRSSRTGPVCDIVGTGNTALGTINCRTPAAIIAASCGLSVAKKGTRAVTSVSGASDVLEFLGVDLEAPFSQIENCLNRNGICYIPGEAYMKSGWSRLIPSMKFTSAFNIAGPLTRPCRNTNCMVIGGYAPHICDQLITVLRQTGMTSAISPYGMVKGVSMNSGMDVFSPSGPTRVVEMRDSHTKTYNVVPEDFGLAVQPYSGIETLSTTEENARAILNVLSGDYDNPLADFFCMNAAAALYIADMAKDYAEGMIMARKSLASGKAYEKFRQLIECQGKGAKEAS